jgi:hypothetical protein
MGGKKKQGRFAHLQAARSNLWLQRNQTQLSRRQCESSSSNHAERRVVIQICKPGWRKAMEAKLKIQLNQCSVTISKLTSNLEEAQASCAQLQSNYTQLEDECKKLTRQNDLHLEEVTQLQRQLQTISSETRQKIQQVSDKKDAKIKMQSQLISNAADLKKTLALRKCRNPHFDTTNPANLDRWSSAVETFLTTMNLGDMQRAAVARRLAQSQGLVVVTEDEYKGMQQGSARAGSQDEIKQIEIQGARKVLEQMKASWTCERWIGFRCVTNTSLRKVTSFNSLISTTPDRNRLTIDIGGTPLPMAVGPSSYFQRLQIKKDLLPFESQPLYSNCKDSVVIGSVIDVQVVIRNEVLVRHDECRLLMKNDSVLVCKEDDQPLMVVWGNDGMNGFSSQKIVLFNLRFFPVGPTEVNQSLHRVKVVAGYEGQDDNETICRVLDKSLDYWNDVITKRTVETDQGTMQCEHKQVLDIVACQANYGMEAHPTGYMCPFCTCPSRENCNVKGQKYPPRTIKQCQLLSHTSTGLCPGCGYLIVTQEEFDRKVAVSNTTPFPVLEKMFVVAAYGDKLPASYKSKFDRSWVLLHLGIGYGTRVQLLIEPEDTAACLMHCDSCVTSMCFSSSVLACMETFHGSGQGRESICKQIYDLLDKCSLKLPKLRPVSNDIGMYYNSLNKYKCTGRATEVLRLAFREILALTYPSAMRAKQSDMQDIYQRHLDMWVFYVDELWPLLNNDDPCLSSTEQANHVEEKATTFMDLYVRANKQTSHLYPHIMKDHFADMWRKFRVHLKQLQLQSVENKNKDTKFKQANTGNRKKSHEVVEEVSSYKRTKNGLEQTVRAHQRSSGQCRVAQVVNQQVLGSIYGASNVDIDAVKVARLRTAKKNILKTMINKKLIEEFNAD